MTADLKVADQSWYVASVLHDSHQSLSMSAYKYVRSPWNLQLRTYSATTSEAIQDDKSFSRKLLCKRLSCLWCQLETFCEAGIHHDKYAVAVTKENSGEVIGHIPRNISHTSWYFIKSKGEITGEVTG